MVRISKWYINMISEVSSCVCLLAAYKLIPNSSFKMASFSPFVTVCVIPKWHCHAWFCY